MWQAGFSWEDTWISVLVFAPHSIKTFYIGSIYWVFILIVVKQTSWLIFILSWAILFLKCVRRVFIKIGAKDHPSKYLLEIYVWKTWWKTKNSNNKSRNNSNTVRKMRHFAMSTDHFLNGWTLLFLPCSKKQREKTNKISPQCLAKRVMVSLSHLFNIFAKNFILLCKSFIALSLRFWFLVSRPSMSPILQWPAIISNVAPRRAGMSKKFLRALLMPYFSRTTTKSTRSNLNLYLRSFLGSLGGLRVLILLTVIPFLVRRPQIEDCLCFQQVDRSYLNTVFPWSVNGQRVSAHGDAVASN